MNSANGRVLQADRRGPRVRRAEAGSAHRHSGSAAARREADLRSEAQDEEAADAREASNGEQSAAARRSRVSVWLRNVVGAAAVAGIAVTATAALDGEPRRSSSTGPAPLASPVAQGSGSLTRSPHRPRRGRRVSPRDERAQSPSSARPPADSSTRGATEDDAEMAPPAAAPVVVHVGGRDDFGFEEGGP